MLKKALEEEYVMQFIDMQKLITNILKTMIKRKNHHILNMTKNLIQDIFWKLIFNIQKNYMNFIMTYHFYLKE